MGLLSRISTDKVGGIIGVILNQVLPFSESLAEDRMHGDEVEILN